jgi:hypothetical protein
MKLWVGGSSGLARTYCNVYDHEQIIMVGREPTPPPWLESNSYVSCDLVSLAKNKALLHSVMQQISGFGTIHQVILGVRPPLIYVSYKVAHFYNSQILIGLEYFLTSIIEEHHPELIVHISSIAAVDHVRAQHLESVVQPTSLAANLVYPYDCFKKGCEELVERLAKCRFTNLRFGAILSDTESCIECGALSLQILGPYTKTKIDVNSSRNASHLIHLILQTSTKTMPQVYYYTRCLSEFPQPVPYGECLMSYRRAYELEKIPLLIPWILVSWCFRFLHFITLVTQAAASFFRLHMPPFLECFDYLMQVPLNEHTFDNTPVLHDFPEIVDLEASIETCLRRRRAYISNKQKIE